jgi:hypothetical protein
MHEKHMRPAGDVWMASNREYADLAWIRIVRKLPVEIIEVIPPNIFNISRIHPPMAIGTVLDEHHWRQVVNIPTSRDLDKAGLFTSDQGLHPGFGFLRVVDFRPRIAGPQPVHVGIVVRHRVVVLDAVAQHQLDAFVAGLPPA